MGDLYLRYDNNGQNIDTKSDIVCDSIIIANYLFQYPSSIKATVDTSVNLGPNNGLLIPAAPAAQYNMNITLLNPTGLLQVVKPYQDDPNIDYTINPKFIRINNPGRYLVSFNLIVLSNNANERKSVWILELGQAMFVNPPIIGLGIRNSTPITNPFFNSGYSLSGSCIIDVTVQTDLIMALFLDNTASDNEILRSTNFCISRIS